VSVLESLLCCICTDHYFCRSFCRPPIVQIEPSNIVPDMLHLLLSCSKQLYLKCIHRHVNTDAEALRIHAVFKRESWLRFEFNIPVTNMCHHHFVGLDIYVPSVKKRSTDIVQEYTKVSFAGKDSRKFIEGFHEFLEEIRSVAGDERVEMYSTLRNHFVDAWNALAVPISDPNDQVFVVTDSYFYVNSMDSHHFIC
jgi:hypothetical protein